MYFIPVFSISFILVYKCYLICGLWPKPVWCLPPFCRVSHLVRLYSVVISLMVVSYILDNGMMLKSHKCPPATKLETCERSEYESGGTKTSTNVVPPKLLGMYYIRLNNSYFWSSWATNYYYCMMTSCHSLASFAF